jgi:hypothetical protein
MLTPQLKRIATARAIKQRLFAGEGQAGSKRRGLIGEE